MTNYSSGKYAEGLAKFYLRIKGYGIIAENYKTGRGTGAGEIDLIAKKANLIVFIEVKKRKDIDTAAYSIFESQKQRIINGAKAFIMHNPKYENYDLRFDAILIKQPFSIKHIKNAWLLD